MTIQPYEIANFNLIGFASIYNKFIDSNDPVEIEAQWMDNDGTIKKVTIDNVASIKQTIKGDILDEAKARINEDKILDQKIIDFNSKLSTKITDEIQTRITEYKNFKEFVIKNEDQLHTEIELAAKTFNESLQTEVSTARKNEKEISDHLVGEIQDRKDTEGKINKALTDEVNNRITEDTTLNTKIDDTKTDLIGSINKEINDRKEADTEVLSNAKDYTDTNIKAEAKEREAVNAELSNKLLIEKMARTNEFNEISKEIKTEIQRAKNSEGNLKFNDDIKDENGNSPKDITEAINEVDHKYANKVLELTNENHKINNLINSNKDNTEKEIKVISDKIDGILAGSSVNLDSFKELVDYINSIDKEDDDALSKFIQNTLSKEKVLFNGVGFDENGYKAPTQAHYINETISLRDAVKKLDSALYITYDNIEAEVQRAKEAEGDLKFNNIKKDGKEAKDLTEAINIVNEKIDHLYNNPFVHTAEADKAKKVNVDNTVSQPTEKPQVNPVHTNNVDNTVNQPAEKPQVNPVHTNNADNTNKKPHLQMDSIKSKLDKIYG